MCTMCLRACLHAQCRQRSEEAVESSGIGVRDGCEPACRCWKLSPGPFVGATELSLQTILLGILIILPH